MTLVLLTSLIWTMAIVLCVASSAPSIAFLSKLSPLSSWPLVIGCASLGSLRCVSSWLARLGGAILVGAAGLRRALSVGPTLAREAEQADGSVDSQAWLSVVHTANYIGKAFAQVSLDVVVALAVSKTVPKPCFAECVCSCRAKRGF
jgi:hypothetical protein